MALELPGRIVSVIREVDDISSPAFPIQHLFDLVWDFKHFKADLESAEFVEASSLPIFKFIAARSLSIGEFGCAIAHKNVWKEARGIDPKSLLVLERDAKFLASSSYLEEILREFETINHPAIVILGWTYPLSFFDGIHDRKSKFRRIHGAPTGTFGYLINGLALRQLDLEEEVTFFADWPVSVVRKVRFYRTVKPALGHDSSIPGAITRERTIPLKFRLQALSKLLRKAEVRQYPLKFWWRVWVLRSLAQFSSPWRNLR